MPADPNEFTRDAWEANADAWDSRMGDEGNDFFTILCWPALAALLDVQPHQAGDARPEPEARLHARQQARQRAFRDALERAGRHPARVYRECTLYTTLSPCAMCSGAILLYGIPRVVIGENRTFMGEEELLRSAPVGNVFPGVEIQPKGLLATEAFVTIPFAGRHPLAIRSHFFEFLEGDRPRMAHQVEPGGIYSVVVTTGGGLYRYRLEDRVEVTGFVGRTPSLRVLGKEGHVSDLRGEKLHESFVAGALERAFRRRKIGFELGSPRHSLSRGGLDLDRLRRILSRSRPATRTWPWVGSCSRMRSRMNVLLPAPDGPTRNTKSPRGIDTLTSVRATLPLG